MYEVVRIQEKDVLAGGLREPGLLRGDEALVLLPEHHGPKAEVEPAELIDDRRLGSIVHHHEFHRSRVFGGRSRHRAQRVLQGLGAIIAGHYNGDRGVVHGLSPSGSAFQPGGSPLKMAPRPRPAHSGER